MPVPEKKSTTECAAQMSAAGRLDKVTPAITVPAPFPVTGFRMCGRPGEGDNPVTVV